MCKLLEGKQKHQKLSFQMERSVGILSPYHELSFYKERAQVILGFLLLLVFSVGSLKLWGRLISKTV